MGKKPVEYRNTFDFGLFPEYTYTKAQKKRLWLFQGRIEHWRAAINYADSFDEPNKINLLYMLGYNPKMKAYVEKTKHNVVVLCAKIPSEDLKAYDAYWNLIRKFRNVGYADQDGNLAPIYYAERKKEAEYRGTGVLWDELYQCHDEEDRIIAEYERLKSEIGKYFEQYTVIDKLRPERLLSHENLDWIIKQYFPYGREQCGVGEKAYTSIKKIQEALQAGLERADAQKLLDLPAGTDSYEACKQGIRRCQMNLSTAIRSAGVVNLVEIMNDLKKPPYGWGDEVHAAYCFGYAVSGYLDGTWIWDEITFFPCQEAIAGVLRSILLGLLRRRSSYTLVVEDGCRLSSRFAYMFGIGTEEYDPKDAVDERILELYKLGLSERKIAAELGSMSNVAVHKRITKMQSRAKKDMPFCHMAHQVCQKIEQTTRWPVAVIDERLQSAICGAWDAEHHISIPVMGKDSVRETLSYFTPEKCRALKGKLDTINAYVPSLIQDKYGTDVDMEELKKLCTTSASGWLWDSETFWECVDRYVKNSPTFASGNFYVPK